MRFAYPAGKTRVRIALRKTRFCQGEAPCLGMQRKLRVADATKRFSYDAVQNWVDIAIQRNCLAAARLEWRYRLDLVAARGVVCAYGNNSDCLLSSAA